MSVSLKKLTDTQLCKLIADLTHECDALLAENTQLKLSREILAKNVLESCNEIFSAGYHNSSLQRGMLESTGNRNKYPAPIKAMVDEALKDIETPVTDAALAEIRAQGVEALVTKNAPMLKQHSVQLAAPFTEVSNDQK